ncbi:MAG: hypothetical protein JNL75_08770 [Chitinophagales bacterium]|nr:hypothetical protein [Chitinophagales bacterium]
MNKSDVFEIIENVALILGGAVIVNAILNISKKEDTNAEVKKMHTNAIKKAYSQSIRESNKNTSSSYDKFAACG